MIAYKYRGGSNPAIFARDLDSIAGDYFYAAAIDKLNDPFEATYTSGSLEEFLNIMEIVGKRNATEDLKRRLKGVFEKIKSAGVFSLAQKFDDAKLWSHYADRHTGFCVGYEVEMLEKFDGDAHYSHNIINVSYSPTPGELEFDDIKKGAIHFLQKVLGIKHPDWAHEAETRIVTDKEGQMPHDFRAVQSIHFGLNMAQEQIEQVMERLQGRQINYYQMQRTAIAYGLTAAPISDTFAQAPRYLYHIVPLSDDALDTYAKGVEKMALLPYLHKAVEVQRREPYCTAVECAERCLDAAKAGQIYVHYRYNDRNYTRYFTKEEINDRYTQILDLEV